MPLYNCDVCNFKSRLKGDYTRHLNTKKHKYNVYKCNIAKEGHVKMNQNEPEMNQNEPQMNQNEPAKNEKIEKFDNFKEKKFKCSYCDETFFTKPSMRRHELHRCKHNNSITSVDFIKKLREENKNHEKEKKKLYKHIEKLLEKVGDNITNNNTINNKIILNNYGKEDLSHITSDVLDNLIKGPGTMISQLTKMIHFNDEKPQNMNIFIPNKRDKYIKIYRDGNWTLEEKKECIPDIVDKNYFILDSHYENNEYKLNDFSKKNYKVLQDGYDYKEKNIVQQQCEQVELELLNGSQKIKKKIQSNK